ncbi:MAG TPA: histidine phosphatase family protein [Planctomycetes bacterium]|nr:histidine phosphatase family protein [Planctomycetota bacterium]HIK61094.1 histidine phosphatase family protein [Planctomycetota bacterium]
MSSSGTPTRIHLVRHGAVAEPWNERIYGDLDVPLSDLGEQQSRALAHGLQDRRFATVLSSGLARSAYLAELVAQQSGLEAGVDERFRELNRGDWAGWGRDQVEAAVPGAWEQFWAQGGVFPVPGGETLVALQARVGRALEDLAREFEGRESLVVAHKWVLRAAICPVLGLSMKHSRQLHVPYVGTATLEREPGAGWRLAHLSWEALGGWALGSEV